MSDTESEGKVCHSHRAVWTTGRAFSLAIARRGADVTMRCHGTLMWPPLITIGADGTSTAVKSRS